MRYTTKEQYEKDANRIWGTDKMKWRFVCPACGFVASVEDYIKAGANNGQIGFSCIGRLLPNPRDAFGKGPGPCNYAGGGLFSLNPVHIDDMGDNLFEIAGMP